MITLCSTTLQSIFNYLSALDSPRSLAVWLMFSQNEHHQLVDLECSPLNYIDYGEFKDAYAATSYLSKATFLNLTTVKKDVAMGKFWDAEQVCGQINKRGFSRKVIADGPGEWLHYAIIRKIDSILSDFDPEEMVEYSNWGPGVTTLIKGCDTSPVNKFRKETGITQPLDNLMGDLFAVAYPHWDLSTRVIQMGNKVITVPKNAKTDRTIAVEPGLNLWFQKGVGNMIRRRLQRVGLNLNSQERNQNLSRLGSLNNSLATVDFASASDTISKSTVEAILPPRWFSVMDILRSRFGRLGANTFEYEKFSSMGNGFTFELETLIFFSIGHACCSKLGLSVKNLSVYGDDVIIPVGAYSLFIKTCEFYGFHINPKKSYSSSYFRESCGAHWFDGKNCKPLYLKELINTESRIYTYANSLRRIAANRSLVCCDGRFKNAWYYLFNKMRNPCLISDGFGDGGFIVNFDEACPSKARHGIEGYFCRSLISVPISYGSEDHSVLLARLKSRSTDLDFGNRVNLRGRVKTSRKRLFINRWNDLGPWC